MKNMSKNEYNKLYKDNYYNKTRKIVTFPLLNTEHKILENVANKVELSPNSYAKNIVTNFLHNKEYMELSTTQKEIISSFIRQTRGVANNINQIAYQANSNGYFYNFEMLLQNLKRLEDDFKELVSKWQF